MLVAEYFLLISFIPYEYMHICFFCTDKIYSSTNTRVHIFCSWIWPLNLLQGVFVYMDVNIYSTVHTSVCMYVYIYICIKHRCSYLPHRQISFSLCVLFLHVALWTCGLMFLGISRSGSQAVSSLLLCFVV